MATATDIVVSGPKYDHVSLGPGDDHLYRSGFDNVDCGPGTDTLHVSAFGQSGAVVPIERYNGPRRGMIRNCELVVEDDTSDPQSRGPTSRSPGPTPGCARVGGAAPPAAR